MTEDSLRETQRQLIGELFRDLPADLSGRTAAMVGIREEFHRELGKALHTSLNEYLAGKPQETADERREMAFELNALLRGLGLAIKCHNTGLPAIMLIDYPEAGDHEKTRFRLVTKTPDGKMHRSTASRELRLPLDFIPASPRIEHFAKGKPPTERER